jgi:outer membrane protein assembly factor BamD
MFSQKKSAVNSPASGTTEALYKEAKSELDGSGWTRAIEALEKVQAADALGIYGQQALLDTAYAQWRNGDGAVGLATVDRYLKQFPKGEGVPYALYLRGIINFNERSGLLTSFSKEDLSERDPKTLSDSYDAFSRLIKDHPDSKYSKEAAERLTYIVNTLAKHEIGIALFYLQRGAPLAAANRAQDMLKLYSQTPAQEEALGIMAESYKQLGIADLRDSALRVLKQNYPNSRHLAGGIYTAPSKAWYKLW